MKVFLLTVLAGIVASTVRFAFLELISKLRESHVDLIQAIGTIYHGSYNHSLFRGAFVHYFFGLGAAFVYLLFQSHLLINISGYQRLLCRPEYFSNLSLENC